MAGLLKGTGKMLTDLAGRVNIYASFFSNDMSKIYATAKQGKDAETAVALGLLSFFKQ
jgi:hypothetical protein